MQLFQSVLHSYSSPQEARSALTIAFHSMRSELDTDTLHWMIVLVGDDHYVPIVKLTHTPYEHHVLDFAEMRIGVI